jgi:hypothetical protein
MTPNTDTRIFSEVRLAGMNVEQTGEDDPYALLRAHSSLDVMPYIRPEDAAQMLYRAGRYFYRHHSTTLTRRAIGRLEDVDPKLAGRLKDDWEGWRESVRNRAITPRRSVEN